MARKKRTTVEIPMADMWRCNTPQLLQEIATNPQCWILQKPLQIFGNMLYQVAKRAQELNDPQLNQLMLRLALYEQGDPYAKGYRPDAFDDVLGKKAIDK